MAVNPEAAAIGGRLKEARLAAGATQREAAAATGVTRATISNWEAGRNLPNLIQFRQLLSLYGVTGHMALFGHHPMALTSDEVRELTAAARAFSLSLRRKTRLFLVLTGASWMP